MKPLRSIQISTQIRVDRGGLAARLNGHLCHFVYTDGPLDGRFHFWKLTNMISVFEYILLVTTTMEPNSRVHIIFCFTRGQLLVSGHEVESIIS